MTRVDLFRAFDSEMLMTRRYRRLAFLTKGADMFKRGRNLHRRTAERRRSFIEQLEARIVLATDTVIDFDLPPDLPTGNNLFVALYGQQQSTGDFIYLDPTSMALEPAASLMGQSNCPSAGDTGCVPMFEFSSDSQITLPLTASENFDGVKGGAATLFIAPEGMPPNLQVTVDSMGLATIPAPTVSTFGDDIYALFEWSYVANDQQQYSLDVDLSNVDEVGFPLSIEASDAGGGEVGGIPFYLQQVGIRPGLSREELFDRYRDDPTIQGSPFQVLGNDRVTNGNRILAPQNFLSTIDTAPSQPLGVFVAKGAGDSPFTEPVYWYKVTAVSADGETQPSFAQFPGDATSASAIGISWQPDVNPITTQYRVYRGLGSMDGVTPVAPASDQYFLIDTINLDADGDPTPGQSVNGFDISVQDGMIQWTETNATPPDPGTSPPQASNNYGFEPLSTYFDSALKSFFDYYDQTIPGNENHVFNLTTIGDTGTRYAGQVIDWTPTTDNPTNASYKVLQLTATDGHFHSTASGTASAILNVYYPYFGSYPNPAGPNANPPFTGNTRSTTLPPVPQWLLAAGGTNETASQMVFGQDGIFFAKDPEINTLNTMVPDGGNLTTEFASILNMISTAFERAVATDFDLAPSMWANFPLVNMVPAATSDAGGQLAAGTYLYSMTAVDQAGNESTPGLELKTTVGTGMNGVTLGWNAINNQAPNASEPFSSAVYQSYRVYRRASVADEPTLVYEIINDQSFGNPGQSPGNPVSEFTDLGLGFDYSATPWVMPQNNGGPPPYQYYAQNAQGQFLRPGNLYARFLHQDATLDSDTGVSLYGLAYAFPFDDQGGLSTNIQYQADTNPAKLTLTINDWTIESSMNPVVESKDHGGNLTLQREDDQIVLRDNDTDRTLLARPLNSLSSLTIQGQDLRSDELSIDLSAGELPIPEGVHFQAGTGGYGFHRRDTVNVITTDDDQVLTVRHDGLSVNGLHVGHDDVEFVQLSLGSGDDHVEFIESGGSTTLADSGGTDTIDFSDAARRIRLHLRIDRGQLQSTGVGRVGLRGTFEHVVGSAFGDRIIGNRADNLIRGGGGNDVIMGFLGDNILVGGHGHDTLYARGGTNVLIGGEGRDILLARRGADLLVGGSTDHDDDHAALLAIHTEWRADTPLAVRRDNLQNGGGANGAFVLRDGETVLDDQARDRLLGDEQDWLLDHPLDWGRQ